MNDAIEVLISFIGQDFNSISDTFSSRIDHPGRSTLINSLEEVLAFYIEFPFSITTLSDIS
jgi:hypothetical protein